MEPTDNTIPDRHFRIAAPGVYTRGAMPFDSCRDWHGITLILCLGGTGQLRINGCEYGMSESALAFIMPSQHAELLPQSDFRMLALAFTFDFMSDFPFSLKPDTAEKMAATPCIRLSAEQRRVLSEYHALITKQYQRTDHPSRTEVIKALTFGLLAEINYICSRQKTTTSRTHQENIVHDFFGLLHVHHVAHRDTSFYADKLCLTSKHLSHIIKQVTGKSLYAWITEFVIQDAKRLLQTTTLTISEISDRLLFPNASFFGRYFKKNTGFTPLRFRQTGLANQ